LNTTKGSHHILVDKLLIIVAIITDSIPHFKTNKKNSENDKLTIASKNDFHFMGKKSPLASINICEVVRILSKKKLKAIKNVIIAENTYSLPHIKLINGLTKVLNAIKQQMEKYALMKNNFLKKICDSSSVFSAT
jgi:hypothetical protein